MTGRLKTQTCKDKLKAFSSEIEWELLDNYLKSWKLICDGKYDAGVIGQLELADRFRWLAATRSTIIQSSKTHPGLCSDPKKELDDIFEKHVL